VEDLIPRDFRVERVADLVPGDRHGNWTWKKR
jgi:hypothetical protein